MKREEAIKEIGLAAGNGSEKTEHRVPLVDCDTFLKPSHWAISCSQIDDVATAVLRGWLIEVVESINSQWGEIMERECGWNYAEAGYAFRNGFESACWFMNDFSRIEAIVLSSAKAVLHGKERVERCFVLAWLWHEVERVGLRSERVVARMSDDEVIGYLVPLLAARVKMQMTETRQYVCAEVEKCKKKFEYDEDDDSYCEYVLSEIDAARPNNELIKKALEFVRKFTSRELTAEDGGFVLSISTHDDGGCRYVQFELFEDALSISTGGSVWAEGVGGDSHGDEVWRLDPYCHADSAREDVVSLAVDLLGMGAEISEE